MAFLLVGQAGARERGVQLRLASCTVEHFAHFVEGAGGEDARVLLEHCSLTGARSNAIELRNPLELVLASCLLEKGLGKGVSVLFRAQPGVADNKLERRVALRDCRVLQNIGAGVSVKREKEFEQQQQQQQQGGGEARSFLRSPKLQLVEVRRCVIRGNKKEGVALSGLTMHPRGGRVWLDETQLAANCESNVWVQGVRRPFLVDAQPGGDGSQEEVRSRMCVAVTRCSLTESAGGCGLYCGDTNVHVANCDLQRNGGDGMFLSGSREHAAQPFCRVEQCALSFNRASGLAVQEFKGRLELTDCTLCANAGHGLALEQDLGAHGPYSKTSGYDNSQLVRSSHALAVLALCEISENARHGVLLKNVELRARDLNVQLNEHYAIYLSHASRKCLRLRNSDGRAVSGSVGGEWGRWEPPSSEDPASRDPPNKPPKVRRAHTSYRCGCLGGRAR